MGVNTLDLFSGIGGFALGLQQAGIKHDWLGYSDINEYSNKIYGRHFNGAEKLGDITTIQTHNLPRIDIVNFGFPCQDLSVANKQRRGLDGSRSSLFFEAIRIIRDKKPKFFIFENVKGTFNSNNGEDFKIILEAIADIGYDGQWQLLNTRWFLPQNRERIYFIGYPRGQRPPKIFPLGTDKEESDYRKTQGKTTTTVKPGWGNLQNDASYLMSSGDIRRFTPLECERLQGFPDGWTECVADTRRYQALGNAVSVPVVKAIGERLLNYIR